MKIDVKNIYYALAAVMDPKDIDHHESDLYVRCTSKSAAIINECKNNSGLCTQLFVDNIDHNLWYEIPFCYSPFWEERTRYRNERMGEIQNG